ncbi:hypothetical protein Efla_007036 [Eimeria flavescens]
MEGFADDEDYLNEVESPGTHPQVSTDGEDAGPAACISAGATALIHASELDVDPYGGALEQNDSVRADLLPSTEGADSQLQQIAQETADFAADDVVDPQHHDLPPPQVLPSEGEHEPETWPPSSPDEAPEHLFPWGPDVPASKYAKMERLADMFALKTEDLEALPAFQAASALLRYLEAAYESWELMLQQSASSSNQLFPSYFVLNKKEEEAHKHSSQQEQRHRILLPAQAAFLVYPIIIHLYKTFARQPRSVQRSISAIASFLNGKELLLVPAAIIPMQTYLDIAGDALPEPTAEESDKKTRARMQLSFLLRGYSLRVLDASQPQSPLMEIDKKALSQLSKELTNELADPLEPHRGSWLQVSKASAERMDGLRIPSADWKNSLQLIQQAREMSQSVAHLTRVNGPAMVKAYKEIQQSEEAASKRVLGTAKAHAQVQPEAPLSLPTVEQQIRPGKHEEHQDEIDGLPVGLTDITKTEPLSEKEAARAAKAVAAFKRLVQKKDRQAKATEQATPATRIDEDAKEKKAEERESEKLAGEPLEGQKRETKVEVAGKVDAKLLAQADNEEAREEEEEKKEELKEQAEALQKQKKLLKEGDKGSEKEAGKASAKTTAQEASKSPTLRGILKAAAAISAFKRPQKKHSEKHEDKATSADKAAEEKSDIEEDKKEEDAEEKESSELTAAETASDKTAVDSSKNKPSNVKTFGALAKVASATSAFKRPIRKHGGKRSKDDVPDAAAKGMQDGVHLEEADIADTAGAEAKKHEEKNEGTKDKLLCPGFHKLSHEKEPTFLSNLQAFADEYGSVPEVTEINRLEAQLLRLSEKFAKDNPVHSRWKAARKLMGKRSKKRGKKSKSHHTSSSSQASDKAGFPGASYLEYASKRERKQIASEAAKLLLQIAERTLMGSKTLQLWIECCNLNHAAKTAGKEEWGGDPALARTLDSRLLHKALKMIKKSRFPQDSSKALQALEAD